MDLKNKTVNGVKWTTVSSILMSLASLIKISVLARYLEKSDFGLIAIVTLFLGFIELFMDLGLTAAILHKKEISKREYASLYWLNSMVCAGLYALILLISPIVSDFYKEDALLYLLPIMGVSLILNSIGRQFKTIEQKEMNFRYIALVDIISAVLSLVLAIYLAVAGYGVYSLVYSYLLLILSSNLIFLFSGLKKYGLKLHYQFDETKPFLKIGIYNTGGQVINYFNKEIDILIIGKFFGTEILGLYSLAKQLVIKPTKVINPILTKVATPLFSKIQDEKQNLTNHYLKLVNIISSINVPVYLIIVVFASPIIHILYGAGYESIETLVRILSIYMLFIALRNPMGSLTIAAGRTDLEFYWTLITFIIMPVAILIGSLFTVEVVAWAVTLVMAVLFVPMWKFVITKIITVDLKTYIISHIPDYNFLYKYVRNKI